MNKPLAVFTPAVGAVSETFIRRHVEDLLPGKTAVISLGGASNDGWHLNGYHPRIALYDVWRHWSVRAVAGLSEYSGLPLPDLAIRTIEKFLKRNNVKAILGEYLDKSLWLLPIAIKLGIQFFVHAHGYDVSAKLKNRKWQEAYLKYNECAGVIVVSKFCRDRLVKLGIDRTKIHVIPCGVDVPEVPLARRSNSTVRCLAVGRMVAKKAPILTLDAFRRALEHYPNMHLDYIGEGDQLPAVRQFVSALDLEEKVTLHGGQPHEIVNRLMIDSDIFLQHSMTDPDSGDEEGLPVGILEAMAHSLPVISTFHSGIPEAVSDGLTGLLVDEGDSMAMADRIISLAKDYQLRTSLGMAGWKRTSELFSWNSERASLLRVMNLKQN